MRSVPSLFQLNKNECSIFIVLEQMFLYNLGKGVMKLNHERGTKNGFDHVAGTLFIKIDHIKFIERI